MFPMWIRSHADLPFKTFQVGSSFGYKAGRARSLLASRESRLFESHTAHRSEDGATGQVEADLEILSRLTSDLGLPCLVSKRPRRTASPGAWYTLACDVVLPDGRTLEVASCSHYLDQWSRAFGIEFVDEEGASHFVQQTATKARMERLLGAVVACHGDDRGLVFPPCVAPVQVVVVPIVMKAMGGNNVTAEQVLREAERVCLTLKESGGIRA